MKHFFSVCLSLTLLHSQSTVKRGGGEGCILASALGFKLDDTDETALLNSTLADYYTKGGLCLFIDGDQTLGIFGQIVFPNSGLPNCTSVPFRITGNASSAGNGINNMYLTGGSKLDLRFNGTKLIALGTSKIEIDHVNLIDNGTDCGTYFKHTMTSAYIHDATFWGNSSVTGTDPSAACNVAIVTGGTGVAPGGAIQCTEGDWAGGQLFAHDNRFEKMATAWLAQNSANGNVFRSNQIQGGMATGSKAAIDIQGFGSNGNANRGNTIESNLIELWAHKYTCGINLHNAEGNGLCHNGFWDGDANTFAFCGDSTAIKNTICAANHVDTTGTKLLNATWSTNNSIEFLNQSTAPSVDNTNCTGATIGANSTITSGTITGLPTGTCTVILTMATPSPDLLPVIHGWSCAVSNQITGNLIRQTASNATTVTFSGVSVSGDVLAYGPCAAF